MFERIGLSTLALAATMAVATPAVSLARDRDDGARGEQQHEFRGSEDRGEVDRDRGFDRDRAFDLDRGFDQARGFDQDNRFVAGSDAGVGLDNDRGWRGTFRREGERGR
jgi:hypothetical protein